MAWTILARVNAKAADRVGALRAYDRALELSPRDSMLHMARGELRVQTGDDRGFADLEEAVRVAPDEPRTWRALGEALYSRRRFREAEAAATRAIELAPRHWRSLHSRGVARGMLGDHAGALVDLAAALQARPGDAGLLADRGNVRLGADDPAGALEDLDASLGLAREAAPVLAMRSRARRLLGDLDRGFVDAMAAIAIDPAWAGGYEARGQIHAEYGHAAAAIWDLERALQLDPDDDETRAALDERRRRAGAPR